MPAFNGILFQVDGAVAVLSLQPSPDTHAQTAELRRVLERLAANDNIRALVVTGGRKDLIAQGGLARLSLRTCRVPVITALHGDIAADGLELCGDLLLCSDTTTFSTAGETLTANQALARGAINDCVEEAHLLPRARQWAEALAQGPTRALALTRALVDESTDNSFQDQYRRELQVNRALRDAPDGIEGVRAFLEKRPARFREV